MPRFFGCFIALALQFLLSLMFFGGCGHTPIRSQPTPPDCDSDTVDPNRPRCEEGWGNCDEHANNGCETELIENLDHCGRCRNACSSGEGCVSGQCATIEAIASGRHHSCALWSSGRVSCWGRNTAGQLGQGTTVGSSFPTIIDELHDVVSIDAGGFHTCSVTRHGEVSCWGAAESGQVGLGRRTRAQTTPAPIDHLQEVVQVRVGWRHSCALTRSGAVWCWGENEWGQVGDGTSKNDRDEPVRVSDLSNARALALGRDHSCAIVEGGEVHCWGRNRHGQLGDGTTEERFTIERAEGLTDITGISAGDHHTCALRNDGRVLCWGKNNERQAAGYRWRVLRPSVVGGVDNAESITAGARHSCAVSTGGHVRCWGQSSLGQLGNAPDGAPAVGEEGHERRASHRFVSAGGFHTCGVTDDGVAHCWGDNTWGQLGDGASVHRFEASPVVGLEEVTSLAAGARHSCAVVTGGSVWCWGLNDHGQLGTGTTESQARPTEVLAIEGAVEIAAGEAHSCARKDDGSISCWGRGLEGQLGDGESRNRLTPVTVAGLSGAIDIATGMRHSCAVMSEGTLACWGENQSGQVFESAGATTAEPYVLSALTGVVEVVAGRSHSCARRGTPEEILCWGDHSQGQLGSDDPGPVQELRLLGGLTSMVALEAGTDHTCALSAEGAVYCWGWNRRGEVGVGHRRVQRSPAAVPDVEDATSIAAGGRHSCAVHRTGTVSCWGFNHDGQLGRSDRQSQLRPLLVDGVEEARDVVAGIDHSCVRGRDGSVMCWGANRQGELGDGTAFVPRFQPVLLVGIR